MMHDGEVQAVASLQRRLEEWADGTKRRKSLDCSQDIFTTLRSGLNDRWFAAYLSAIEPRRGAAGGGVKPLSLASGRAGKGVQARRGKAVFAGYRPRNLSHNRAK